MKMSGLFFGSLFWGILISLIGLSIVLRHAFNIQFPLIRLFLGIIIILIGLRLVMGSSGKQHAKQRRYVSSYYNSKEFDVIFSNRTIDFSKYADVDSIPGEITVVFGNAVVIVPDSLNLEVSSTTVFGSTILPDRSYAGFGEDRYVINNNPGAPVHRIETTTVFGKLEFEIVPSKTKSEAEPDTTGTKTEESF